MIGLVQAGAQSRADRYTYLPLVGIFVMLAWSVAAACKRWPRAKWAIGGVTAAGYAVCLALTGLQVAYWKDSESLFLHAIGVTRDNYVAYNGLGLVERERHRFAPAIADYRGALRIRPFFLGARNNLSEALLEAGRVDEATTEIVETLRLKPDLPDAHINLAVSFDKRGRPDAAMAAGPIPAQLTRMRAGPWAMRAVATAASPLAASETSQRTARPPIPPATSEAAASLTSRIGDQRAAAAVNRLAVRFHAVGVDR